MIKNTVYSASGHFLTLSAAHQLWTYQPSGNVTVLMSDKWLVKGLYIHFAVCVWSYRSLIVWLTFSWQFLSSFSILGYRFVVVCMSSGTIPSVHCSSCLTSAVHLQYQGLTDLHSQPVSLLTEPHSVSRSIVVFLVVLRHVIYVVFFMFCSK